MTPARAEPSGSLRHLYALAACAGAAAFGLLPYLWALAAVSVLVNAPAMFIVMCLHDPVMTDLLLRSTIDLAQLPPPNEATHIFAVSLGAEVFGAVTGHLVRLLLIGKLGWPAQPNRAA